MKVVPATTTLRRGFVLVSEVLTSLSSNLCSTLNSFRYLMEKLRAWLSIELMRIAIYVCPYEEMQDLLRNSISRAVDEYFNEGE